MCAIDNSRNINVNDLRQKHDLLYSFSISSKLLPLLIGTRAGQGMNLRADAGYAGVSDSYAACGTATVFPCFTKWICLQCRLFDAHR
jgi:hypothetical protein